MGIEATEQDVGRRVRLRVMPRFGRLMDAKGCSQCERPCCYVKWDDGKTVATWQSHLTWADEEE